MEIEQWLEEAMVMTNRSLRLIPSSVLKECIESCRAHGTSLVAIARASSQLGLVNEEKLLYLKERIPEPHVTPPSREQVLAFKKSYQTNVGAAHFLFNYLIGVARQIPVMLDFHTPDEKATEDLSRVLGSLVRKTIKDNSESPKEGKDGDGNDNLS